MFVRKIKIATVESRDAFGLTERLAQSVTRDFSGKESVVVEIGEIEKEGPKQSVVAAKHETFVFFVEKSACDAHFGFEFGLELRRIKARGFPDGITAGAVFLFCEQINAVARNDEGFTIVISFFDAVVQTLFGP